MFAAPAPPRQRPGWVQIARAGDGLARLWFSSRLTADAVVLSGRTAAQMPQRFGAPAPPRQRPGWVQIAKAGDGLARLRFSAGLTAAAVVLSGRTAAQMHKRFGAPAPPRHRASVRDGCRSRKRVTGWRGSGSAPG